MKTIADFKRLMVKGSQWSFTAHWHKEAIVRECLAANTIDFGLKHPTKDGISYCTWPKKAEVLEIGEKHIMLRGEGFPENHFLRYELI